MIRIVLTFILTSIFYIAIDLGFSWINEGHGLHPALAFTIAALAMACIVFMLYFSYVLQQQPPARATYPADYQRG